MQKGLAWQRPRFEDRLLVNKIKTDIGATHEMIPKHCPSTPRQGASLFFHPWPIRQNPRVFWLAGATINHRCYFTVIR